MLKRVRIKNYKSLDVDVELDPITVLIGKSGTGKTNFVDALRFLRDCVRRRQAHFQPVLSKTASFPATVLFDVEFGNRSSDDLKYHLEFGPFLGPNHFRTSICEESLVFRDNIIFRQMMDQWEVAPQIDVPGGAIALGHRLPELQAKRARAFLKSLGCYSFSGTLGRTSRSSGLPGLTDNGDNLAVVLDQILDDPGSVIAYERITNGMRLLNPSIVQLDAILTSQTSVTIRHAVTGGHLDLDLSDESTGFRNFLACMAAIYQQPSKQVIIIEEPENGIHPGALATLAEEFKACPEDRRVQVILTTHSPQFLDHFDIDNVRLVELDGAVTRINRIAREQVEAIKDGLMSPGELFTVDEARSASVVEPEA
jgi:predicted ATPase